MRRILWAALATVLGAIPVACQAEEPRGRLIDRGRDVVQACFHKHCDKQSCGSSGSCNPCGEDDVRIGRLIDTLFHGERACDRKNAALKLDRYNWTQHPEIVAALTYAMQSDCDRCVRIAAADSLKDMRVSDPDSMGAMQFSRAEDPSCRVRYKAKWGVIKGEKHRPPCLTYVSGYGRPVPDKRQDSPAPLERLQPTPDPDRAMPMPEQKELDEPSPGTGTETRRGIRSRVSSVMAKVRSRS